MGEAAEEKEEEGEAVAMAVIVILKPLPLLFLRMCLRKRLKGRFDHDVDSRLGNGAPRLALLVD